MPAMNAAPAGRRRTLDLKPFILYASYTLGTGHLELHARHIAAKAKHVEAGSEVLGGILISSRAFLIYRRSTPFHAVNHAMMF